MPFRIIRNDITKVKADAIVNTANPEPIYAGGTDAAVYKAAGADLLLKERRRIGQLRAGEAAVTPAFDLPAKYVIHTVGPVWKDGESGELDDLAACYRKSLLLAEQLGCESVAFPLISTGVYGFPKDRALSVALREIEEFLADNDSDMDVILVVFDKKAYELSTALVADVGEYIDEKYVAAKRDEEYRETAYTSMPLADHMRRPEADRSDTECASYSLAEAPKPKGGLFGMRRRKKEEAERERRNEAAQNKPKSGSEKWDLGETILFLRREEAADAPDEEMTLAPSAPSSPFHATDDLAEVMRHLGDSFQVKLFRMIDERKLADSVVYKKANLDRKLFSKIRCNPDYKPQKKTALALAMALNLSLDETIDLLMSAGLALSPSNKADLIVVYCIEHGIYDLFDVNALLFEYDQMLLGG